MMNWGYKDRNWNDLIFDIQSEVDANKKIIPNERIKDIEHYLNHGEYSMAFEYLYLEIMERSEANFILGPKKVNEIALFFELNKKNECMIDEDFWDKLQNFLNR